MGRAAPPSPPSDEETNRTESVLRCAWLVNPGEAPRQNVRITVSDGVVAEIADLPADERQLAEHVALIPKFVNAHTHLEFSDLPTPLQPPEPFTEWIGSVIQHRIARGADSETCRDSIRSGLQEIQSGGTRLVGEITTLADGVDVLKESTQSTGMTAVSFRELIGFTADRIAEQLRVAEEHLAALKSGHVSSSVVAGISPHAPYSVHPDIVDAVADLALANDVSVAMHLAETIDELQLLDSKTGRFVDLLSRLGLWDTTVLKDVSGPLDYLKVLSRAPHALAIHCNYLTDDEIRFLGDHPNVAVVYCPRTHAFFRHPPHPWQKLLAAGATVILGTDSRASNPDLSIWRDLQQVARQPAAPEVWTLLPMITTRAASALGCNPDDFRIQTERPLNAVEVNCECDRLSGLNLALSSTDADVVNCPDRAAPPGESLL